MERIKVVQNGQHRESSLRRNSTELRQELAEFKARLQVMEEELHARELSFDRLRRQLQPTEVDWHPVVSAVKRALAAGPSRSRSNSSTSLASLKDVVGTRQARKRKGPQSPFSLYVGVVIMSELALMDRHRRCNMVMIPSLIATAPGWTWSQTPQQSALNKVRTMLSSKERIREIINLEGKEALAIINLVDQV
jgi:hypothetical protein